MISAVFNTQRLTIRPYKAEDTDMVWEVLNSEEIYKTTYAIPKDYPKRRVEKWFKFTDNQRMIGDSYEYGMFTKNTKEYVGNCGIISVKKNSYSGAITYFVAPSMWNKGYATEAGMEMLKFGFAQLGLVRISGTCMNLNVASRRVMEKLGFAYEGTARKEIFKDGEFIDVDHLAIIREDFFRV